MAVVTIAIPFYNEVRFLRETLDSALAQEGVQKEIVICDNCSTDGSSEIAQEYARENSCIRLIRHPENIGAAENFEYCLTLARTKYFIWLGAHDLLTGDYISKAIEHLEKYPETVLVYPSEAVFVDSENHVVKTNACSRIEFRACRSPIKRIIHVVRNLGYCTNIHGVFVTDVARKLPFEKIAGPDNLQLAVTAFYGEIHAVQMEGIRRREVRQESDEQREERWIDQKIFPSTWYHPRLLLIRKHFEFVFENKEIPLLDKLEFCIRSPFIFRWWRPLKSTCRRLWSRLF